MELEYYLEKEACDAGFSAVCGVDEAGRGPLAGNVVAAAVILPQGLVIEGLNDSKKLSEKKRDALYDVIIKEALAYSVAWATPAEIDEHNILGATMIAMNRAVNGLSVKADFALIDGNCARGFNIPTQTVIKGDAKSPSIAAASILAKVTRDRQCAELHENTPNTALQSTRATPRKIQGKKG